MKEARTLPLLRTTKYAGFHLSIKSLGQFAGLLRPILNASAASDFERVLQPYFGILMGPATCNYVDQGSAA